MSTILAIKNLNKTYAGGFQALKNINLEIRKGEIFAFLGPNGAGKTTLINSICGIVNPTAGVIKVDGFMAGFLMVWREKNQRRLALGFTAAGILLFYLLFRSLPKYC